MSERAQTEEIRRDLAVVHLSEDPNETFLLSEELSDEGLPTRVERVGDSAGLWALLGERLFDLVIVDLPLPAAVAPQLLDDLSSQRPELAVVFRWGASGAWTTEAPGEQLGRTVRHALALRPDRAQTAAERQQLLRQLTLQQQAFLELSKGDLWDFDATLARITATVARVLRVARVGVWELDADGVTLHCLELFDARTGRHGREADLNSFPRYLTSLQSALTLAAHDAQHDPRTVEFLDAYLKPLDIRAMLDAPIRRDGRVVGVVCHEHVGLEARRWTVLEQCAATSVAGLVARAMEVRDRRRFEARATRLERFETIGTLTSGIAHDLNNLLIALMFNVETAAAPGTSPEERRKALQVTREATESVQRLARDLLAVGRSTTLVRRTLDLREFLSRQEPLLRAAAGRDADFQLRAGARPVEVEADADALSRVLLNLVRNASESLTAPGVVEVSLDTIDTADPTDEFVRGPCAVITVRDTGRGMEPETLDRIFEPFFTTKSGRQGHGLGLATAFGLVRQHDGTIRVASELGLGSRFEVHLPLAKVE